VLSGGLTFGIPFHLQVKIYWHTAGSRPFLLKRLWWAQQENIFQCLNHLGKEIQSNTFFSIHGLTPSLLISFSAVAEPWAHLPHLKRRDIHKIIITPTTTSPQLPVWFLQLMHSGHIANSIATAGNSAPTPSEMLMCLRSPSSSLPLLKRTCITLVWQLARRAEGKRPAG